MCEDKSVYYKRLDRLNMAAKRAYQLYKSGILSLEKYSLCIKSINNKSEILWNSALDLEYGVLK